MSSRTVDIMRLLVEHSPTALAYWDRELRCCYANRAYERGFQLPPGALIGMAMQDLNNPDVYRLNRAHIEAVLAGEPQRFLRSALHPTGERRSDVVSYTPVHDAAGSVVGFLADVTDVTALAATEAALRREMAERERTHARLEASAEQLREAERLGHIGSWEWDPITDTVTWSAELGQIFGRDPEGPPPAIGASRAYYEPSSWRVLAGALEHTMRTGEPYVVELQYNRPDGTLGWLEARGEALRDATGAIVKLHGTGQDISQRRQAEQDRISLEVVEAASRNKTLLLSRVSHELRTPLNGILGCAQLLQLEALEPAQLQCADAIYAKGQEVLGLVDQVLEITTTDS